MDNFSRSSPQPLCSQLEKTNPYIDYLIDDEVKGEAWASANGPPDPNDPPVVAKVLAQQPTSNPTRIILETSYDTVRARIGLHEEHLRSCIVRITNRAPLNLCVRSMNHPPASACLKSSPSRTPPVSDYLVGPQLDGAPAASHILALCWSLDFGLDAGGGDMASLFSLLASVHTLTRSSARKHAFFTTIGLCFVVPVSSHCMYL